MAEAAYVATLPKAPPARAEPILDIADLRTWFFTRDGIVRAVDGVSFHVIPV
jgi:ABC-type glutathione transport system ATPase component